METRKMALQDMKKRENNTGNVEEDKKCDKCGKSLYSIINFKKRFLNLFRNSKVYFFKFSKNSFFSDITFPTVEGLSYHKMTQTYAEGTKYRCPVCSIESCHYYGIKTHIENAHNNKEKVKNLKFEANQTASGTTLYTAKNYSGSTSKNKNDSMETSKVAIGDENVNKLRSATTQNSTNEEKKVEKENFKCDMCQNSFNNIQALNYHKAKNVKFRCPHCMFVSCTQELVMNHLADKHKDKILNENEKTPEIEKPSCDKCNATFENVEAVNEHKKVQNYLNNKAFKCPKCEVKICHIEGIKAHYANTHTNKAAAAPEKKQVESKIQTPKLSTADPKVASNNAKIEPPKIALNNINANRITAKIGCETCSMTFENDVGKNEHYKKIQILKDSQGTWKKFQCPKCNFSACVFEGFKDHYNKQHVNGPEEKNQVQQPQLDPNISTNVLTEKLLNCERCTTKFENIEALNQHKKHQTYMGHGKWKTYQCQICEFRSCHYEATKAHIAKNHSNESTKINEKKQNVTNLAQNSTNVTKITITPPVQPKQQAVTNVTQNLSVSKPNILTKPAPPKVIQNNVTNVTQNVTHATQNVSNVTQQVTNVTQNASNLTQNVKVEVTDVGDISFGCGQCYMTFNNMVTYNEHKKTKNYKSGEPFKCTTPLCEYLACDIQGIKTHLEEFHVKNDVPLESEIKIPIANEPPKITVVSPPKKVELPLVAPKTRVFNCDKCNFSFKTLEILENHKKTPAYIGGNKYRCQVCVLFFLF